MIRSRDQDQVNPIRSSQREWQAATHLCDASGSKSSRATPQRGQFRLPQPGTRGTLSTSRTPNLQEFGPVSGHGRYDEPDTNLWGSVSFLQPRPSLRGMPARMPSTRVIRSHICLVEGIGADPGAGPRIESRFPAHPVPSWLKPKPPTAAEASHELPYVRSLPRAVRHTAPVIPDAGCLLRPLLNQCALD